MKIFGNPHVFCAGKRVRAAFFCLLFCGCRQKRRSPSRRNQKYQQAKQPVVVVCYKHHSLLHEIATSLSLLAMTVYSHILARLLKAITPAKQEEVRISYRHIEQTNNCGKQHPITVARISLSRSESWSRLRLSLQQNLLTCPSITDRIVARQTVVECTAAIRVIRRTLFWWRLHQL